MKFILPRAVFVTLVLGSFFAAHPRAGDGTHSKLIEHLAKDVDSTTVPSGPDAGLACAAQKGKVLYENKFDRNRGGSTAPRGLSVKATGAEPNNTQVGYFFNRADYCLDVVFPPNNPNVTAYSVGLRFLSSADAYDFYLADLTNSGVMSLYHGVSTNNIVKLWSANQSPIMKSSYGLSNAIEAIVKDSWISILLNGKLVKTIRARISNDNLRFGFDLEVRRGASPGTFLIKSIRVASVR